MFNDMTNLKIHYLQRVSSVFKVNSGLRQGDTLSPTLLNLGQEKLKRDSRENRRMEVIDEKIFSTYADNIVILRNSQQNVTQHDSYFVS